MNPETARLWARKNRDPFDTTCPLGRFAATGQIEDADALDEAAARVAATARYMGRELRTGRYLHTADRADAFRTWLATVAMSGEQACEQASHGGVAA